MAREAENAAYYASKRGCVCVPPRACVRVHARGLSHDVQWLQAAGGCRTPLSGRPPPHARPTPPNAAGTIATCWQSCGVASFLCVPLPPFQEKLESHVRHPGRKCREVFQMFGAPVDGISKPAFAASIAKLGFILPPTDIDTLFNMLDHGGTVALLCVCVPLVVCALQVCGCVFAGSGALSYADISKGLLNDTTVRLVWMCVDVRVCVCARARALCSVSSC